MASCYDNITTLRQMIQERLEWEGEEWSDIVYIYMKPCTSLSIEEELDRTIDASYGTAEAAPFTAWTEKNVYFPVEYDGCEWVTCVPRNPCDQATSHVGGG